MKIRTLFFPTLVIGSTLLTSCYATLINKTPVILYGYTTNMVVTEDKEPLKIELVHVGTAGLTGYEGSIEYYGAGIRLKRSKQDHVIRISDGTKSVDVVVESKFATGTLLADIVFLGLPFGIIVDCIKGPLRTTKQKHIDVQGELGNAPRQSGRKLKKAFKKSFKE